MAQWLTSLTLLLKVPGSIPGRVNKLFSSLLGAVEDKDLVISSDQGNADSLFVYPTLGIMGEQCCTLNDLPRLNKNFEEKKSCHILKSVRLTCSCYYEGRLHDTIFVKTLDQC